MREFSCPGCGQWLEVPAEYADRAIRCGNCRRVIQPHEFDRAESGGPSPDRGDNRPTPSRRPQENDDDRPARPAGGRWWVWALLLGGVFGLCCCGGVAVVLYKAGNPDWQRFTAPGGEYSVDFPGAPQAKSEPAKWPDGTETTGETQYAVRALAGELYAVQLTPLPPGVTNEGKWDELILNGWLLGQKAAHDSTFVEESRKDVEVNGVKGKEVVGALDDPKAGKGHLTIRIFVVGEKFCFQEALLTKDTKESRANADHFFNSLTLTKPTKDKPKAN